jgi:hypothetical protein
MSGAVWMPRRDDLVSVWKESADEARTSPGLDHGTGHLASMSAQKNQRINDGTG